MSERKMEQSMRLFEALGNVDEELLERSEKVKKVIPLYRYAGMAAAVLMFVVVGGVSLYALQFSGKKTEYAADQGMYLNGALESAKQVRVEGASEEAEVLPEEPLEVEEAAGMLLNDMATAGDTEKSEKRQTEAGDAVLECVESKAESAENFQGSVSGRGAVSLQYLVEEKVVGALTEYLPAEIPAEYFMCSIAVPENGGAFMITLEAEDGTQLTYHAYGLDRKETSEEKTVCIDASGLTEEKLEAALEKMRKDGSDETEFLFRYEGGICVRICGTGQTELLWTLLPKR